MNKYKQILIKYWKHSSFRSLQEDVIVEIVEKKKDTLALLPTGGGKSIIFQVATLAMDGLCIVITPLIALMKDQVETLNSKGIKAVAIHTGMTYHEIDIALSNCTYGDYKFLYLSPERLGTDLFKIRLQKMNICLLAVDESHCISQWGYDFRPSYMRISDIREELPNVPILALTATATSQVVDDIQDKLKFKTHNLFQKSFERKNLVYVVRHTEDKKKYLLRITNKVQGTGIVYVRNRRRTSEIAQFLKKNGIKADYYHAGLENKTRSQKQTAWKQGTCRVIVATNAFGMGIDKADVRFVVHMDVPESLEAYFQEAGRAGRDGSRAYAVLLYNEADSLKQEKESVQKFPKIKEIKRIYNALGNYFQIAVGAGKDQAFDFNIVDFCSKFNFQVIIAYNSLKFLEKEGYLELTENIHAVSKILFLVDRDDLYKFQVANASYDTFIKLLLRSYTAVFQDYAKVDESFLAKKSGTKIDVVKKYLQNLNNAKIIRYIPQKKTPLILYTEDRLNDKSLLISKENYNERRKSYLYRVNTVLKYASSNNKCRSQLLLSYFGDKNPYRCGQCDVCLKRNELDLSKYEFDIILDELKNVLSNETASIDNVIEKLNYNQEKIIKVIQWLLDNDKISYSKDNKLKWM